MSPSSIAHLSDNTFQATINEQPMSVIYFSATWCAPCKLFSKTFLNVAQSGQFPNVFFGKCDIDECQNAASEFNITSIPTVICLKNNKPVSRLVGNKPNHEVVSMLEAAFGSNAQI